MHCHQNITEIPLEIVMHWGERLVRKRRMIRNGGTEIEGGESEERARMIECDDIPQYLTEPSNFTIVDLHTIFIYANKQTYITRGNTIISSQ